MSLLTLGAVTVAAYRIRTGDNTTPGTEVTGALLEAEELLEGTLRRKLASEERTETCVIYPDGRIYPSAYPITAADFTIDGRALRGATPDGGPFIGVFEPVDSRRATVTYTGGFTDETFPRRLAHAVYDLAKGIVDGPSGLAGWATSASVGDVSVSGAAPTGEDLDSLVPGLYRRVVGYRNRWV